MDAEQLNRHYGIPDRLQFRFASDGLVVAEVTTPLATANISLQGGQLMTWQPCDTDHPVVCLTDRARLSPGKALRGGIPVCWPWFGPHDSQPTWPAHGYVRTATWSIVGTEENADGSISVSMKPADDVAAQSAWQVAALPVIRMRVGTSLTVELTTSNLSQEPLLIGEALHTYLRVGSIAQTEVLGLKGGEYVDKVQAGGRFCQETEVKFAGETDRVYLNTLADCVVVDHQLKRRIRIAKSGSQSTVIWNPWLEKASRMDDVGADGWQSFVCVESGNALDNKVEIAAGASHTLSTTISLEH